LQNFWELKSIPSTGSKRKSEFNQPPLTAKIPICEDLSIHSSWKMTSLPAKSLQLKDCGLLKEGYKTDIVVFDPQRIKDNATYANPRQYSTGMDCSIVNGVVSFEKGEYTGARNGILLLLTEKR
jgi:N-acyl-D-aspartate/D-glutamate deacylase